MRVFESILWVRRILVVCAILGFAVATDIEATGPWTSNGPEGGSIRSLAIDPTTGAEC